MSPWKLAADLGVRVEEGQPGERASIRQVDGEWVATIDPALSVRRQGTLLAHECAHPVAQRFGLPGDDATAWRIAAALLLARDDFVRDLRASNGWVEPIVERNPYVSHELVARRAVALHESMILRVIDVTPRRHSYVVTSLGWRWKVAATSAERVAIQEALEHGASEPLGGVRAWRVVDGDFVRILCLSDGEVLTALIGKSGYC